MILPSKNVTTLFRTTGLRFKSTAVASNNNVTTKSSDSVPVVQSLLAAAAGIVLVSASAAVIESNAAVPVYDPKGERFDQSTFNGRFCKMILACDPRLLTYTQDQVKAAKNMIDSYQYNSNSKDSYNIINLDRALWEARRITEAALNADGDYIPRPFRMSGFVPYNGPICVAMIASTTTPTLLFWSWVNQSQNALVNYYNRSSGSTLSNEVLAKSYAAAVGSALTVAFGLATVIQRRFDPVRAKAMLKYVAFPSAVVASSLNCYIVRSPEIESGIPLLDQDGNQVGTSQVAAKRGVYSTTATRALLQAPVYFLPPLLLTVGPIRSFLSTRPQLTVPVTTLMLLTSFGLGLPATIAVFPQISTIQATDVEDRFHHLRDPQTQQPYQAYYYNKGL